MTLLQILLFIIGGFLTIEGALWAIAPKTMERVFREVLDRYNENAIALSGLASLFMGLTLVILGALTLR